MRSTRCTRTAASVASVRRPQCWAGNGAGERWENLLDAWPDYNVAVVEMRDLGQVTLAKMHVGGHAVDSGIPVEQTSWHVWQWRRQKAVWFGVFSTESEALEAVRLRG
jgi:hypothetical protein